MSEDRATLGRWLDARVETWREIDRLLAKEPARRSAPEARKLQRAYRALARDLAIARRSLAPGATLRALDDLHARLHAEIHREPSAPWQQLRELFRQDVPRATRRLMPELVFSVAVFLVSGLVAWVCVAVWPDTAELVLDRRAMEKVTQGELWTDGLFGVIPPSVLSAEIISNNVMVTLTALALGLFFGFGTLYVLVLNGAMLGAIFSFVGQHGAADGLGRFVVAHGIVELSIIVFGAAMGLRLGRALARPGARGRVESLRAESQALTPLLAVLVPGLVGCGVIEGYLSPNPEIGWSVRLAVGFTWAGVFLWTLLGSPLPSTNRGPSGQTRRAKRSVS